MNSAARKHLDQSLHSILRSNLVVFKVQIKVINKKPIIELAALWLNIAKLSER